MSEREKGITLDEFGGRILASMVEVE